MTGWDDDAAWTRLQDTARRLNAASDEITRGVALWEQRLAALRLGVAASLSLANNESVIYAKHKGVWGLYVGVFGPPERWVRVVEAREHVVKVARGVRLHDHRAHDRLHRHQRPSPLRNPYRVFP